MNDLSFTQWFLIAGLAGSAFCFGATLPRSISSHIKDLCEALLIIPALAILAVIAIVACAAAWIGLVTVACKEIDRANEACCRREERRLDPRDGEQRRAWRAIEGKFEAIRRTRGVDSYGRVLRAVRKRGPSDLPYASSNVVDIFGHPSRNQAG